MEKELINQEEVVEPSILDLLLGKNIVAVNKQLPTAQYEVSRLSEAAGRRWCLRSGRCPMAGSRK